VLTSLHITNFRGFKDLTVEHLKRVNLIIGQNNNGKTGLLEALALLLNEPRLNAQNLPRLFRITGGNEIENFWKWIVRDKCSSHTNVGAKFENGRNFDVYLTEGNPPLGLAVPSYSRGRLGNMMLSSSGSPPGDELKVASFSTRPTDPSQDAIDYNRVVQKRGKKQVEALLKSIEPRLESIESLQTRSVPLLYADIGLSEMIPVTQMGQGFNRLLDIYSEIVAADAKVLLIDEIENGIHHSVLPTIWAGLFHAAREVGVQIFATTHSWECVLAADQAAREKDPYELNLIRLDRVDDNIKATIIDQEGLGTAKELHWEMR
jgi:AAA15 family ATPase/GTPase